MRRLMSIAAFLFFFLITLTAVGYFFCYKPNVKPNKKSFVLRATLAGSTANGLLKKIQLKASPLKVFAEKFNFNTRYCFLIDMSVASGRQRFFVYNFKRDSVEMSGLVTHGSGSITGREDLFFSNEPGSNCTSLGKYKIGNAYRGRFGLAYKLHGLDKTNSKAFERFVVLHAHSCVPANDVYPLPICPSLGCPTVAPEFLQKLTRYINSSDEPVLLSIYK